MRLFSLLAYVAMAAGRQPVPDQIRPVDARSAPPLKLHAVRSGTDLTLVVFDGAGRLRPEALAELRALLVDARHDIDHPIHWRLAAVLVAISAHYPGRTLDVVSGYRHINRHHRRSKHTRGRAIDFRVAGVDNRQLFDTLRRSLGNVGLGYYPRSTFVHLDIRARSSFWVDYSGPGQTPCYSRSPGRDLSDGAAERLTYAQAIALGCRRPGGGF